MPGFGLNLFRFVTALSAVTFFGLGVFVLTRKPPSTVHRSFFLFNTSVALWAFGFFLTMFPKIPEGPALGFSRASHFCGGFAGIAFLNFVIQLLAIQDRVKIDLWKTGLACLASFSVITPLGVASVPSKLFFPYYPEPGILYPIWVVNYVYFFVYAYVLLFRALKTERDEQRHRQLTYVLIGVVCGWISCATLFLLILSSSF